MIRVKINKKEKNSAAEKEINFLPFFTSVAITHLLIAKILHYFTCSAFSYALPISIVFSKYKEMTKLILTYYLPIDRQTKKIQYK